METPKAEEDLPMEETATEQVPNDGVKLLEEVFGTKASVTSSTGTSDDSTSNNSSTETKDASKEEAPKKEEAA